MTEKQLSAPAAQGWPLVLKWIVLHAVFLLAACLIFSAIHHLPFLPSDAALIKYDAIHYADIKDHGYHFYPDRQSTVAFFPGFPYFWKATGLNAQGISIINGLLFLAVSALLFLSFKASTREIFIFLSLPTLMFMYVPYSEALFFVPSALLLIGLLKRNHLLIIAGLFLCSICRSAANIFIPAIIITELLSKGNPGKLKNMLLYIFAAISGIFLSAYIEYSQTGQWMGFMTTQQYWEVKLRFPTLPLHTWGNRDWLDGAAFAAGMAAAYIVIRKIIYALKEKRFYADKAVLFSLLYIAGLTAFTLMFKGGALFSLNRYIFPTAFFFVALQYGLRKYNFSNKQLLWLGAGLFTFWLFFGSYSHIKVLLGYLLFTAYLLLYPLLNNKKAALKNAAFYLLYTVNLFIQAWYFYAFITGGWIG